MSHDDAIRDRVLGMRARGSSFRYIAEATRVPRATVARWCNEVAAKPKPSGRAAWVRPPVADPPPELLKELARADVPRLAGLLFACMSELQSRGVDPEAYVDPSTGCA